MQFLTSVIHSSTIHEVVSVLNSLILDVVKHVFERYPGLSSGGLSMLKVSKREYYTIGLLLCNSAPSPPW